MPRTIPANSLSGMMAAESSQAWLVLLTITHSTGTVRFTSDAVNTSFGGNTYYALPFDIILPSNETGKIPEATLVLDNVDRQLIAELRTQSTPMTVQIDVVASGDVAGGNATATYTDFVLRSIDYTSTSISGRLTLEDFLAEPFPKDIFSQSLFPGLFTFGTNTDYEPPVMGQDATDFSEYTQLAALDDWTKESGDGPVTAVSSAIDPHGYSNPTGDRVGDFDLNAHGGSQSYTWDEIGVGDDIEVYTKIIRPQSPSLVGVIFRVDDHGSGLEGYFFGVNGSEVPILGHIEPGNWGVYYGPTIIDNSAPTLILNDRDPVFIRVRMIGSTINAKIWTGSEEKEPGTWTYTATDTNITAAGRVGLYHSENYNGTHHMYCDYFIAKNPYAYAYPSEISAPEPNSGLYDDFSVYTPGTQPYTWDEAPASPYGGVFTDEPSNPDNLSGAVAMSLYAFLQVTVGAIPVDSVADHDMEVLALLYLRSYASQTRTNGVMVRYNTATGAYYRATIDSLGNGRIWKGSTQLGSTVILGLTGLAYFRFRCEGNALKAKWWGGDLGDEPEDWSAIEYDNDYVIGHPGVILSDTTTNTRYMHVLEIATAYQGATASFS